MKPTLIPWARNCLLSSDHPKALWRDLEHFLWYLCVCIILSFDHISPPLLVCTFLSGMNCALFITVSSTRSSLTHRTFWKGLLHRWGNNTSSSLRMYLLVVLCQSRKNSLTTEPVWRGMVDKWRALVSHPSVLFQERICPGPALWNLCYLRASPL